MSLYFLKRLSIFISFILIIVVLDQVTKSWVVSNFFVNESKPIIDGVFSQC